MLFFRGFCWDYIGFSVQSLSPAVMTLCSALLFSLSFALVAPFPSYFFFYSDWNCKSILAENWEWCAQSVYCLHLNKSNNKWHSNAVVMFLHPPERKKKPKKKKKFCRYFKSRYLLHSCASCIRASEQRAGEQASRRAGKPVVGRTQTHMQHQSIRHRRRNGTHDRNAATKVHIKYTSFVDWFHHLFISMRFDSVCCAARSVSYLSFHSSAFFAQPPSPPPHILFIFRLLLSTTLI